VGLLIAAAGFPVYAIWRVLGGRREGIAGVV